MLVRVKSLNSFLKKVLSFGKNAKGGRKKEDVLDVLGMRVVVIPKQQLSSEGAEENAVEVSHYQYLLVNPCLLNHCML